jgi:hypothetical protein
VNQQYAAATEIFDFIGQQGWKACLIGALAAIRWGQPRLTEDVDVSLFCGFGDEAKFVDSILQRFPSRREDMREFALTNRVLLIKASNDTEIDIGLAAFPFEEEVIERATPFEFQPGAVFRTMSAEDVIVSKAFASRPLDWKDVEGVIVRQLGKLNWDLIKRELTRLCALLDDDTALVALDALKSKLENRKRKTK